MKKAMCALALAVAAPSVLALPAVGFCKETYGTKGGSTCAQVTSNTKTVKFSGKVLTYFEMINGDGKALTCIPRVFADTDPATVDGDPAGVIFVSPSEAVCSDGSGNSEDVSFDPKHVFWGGTDYLRVVTPEGLSASVGQKERQTGSDVFASTTACP
jgi:hypothetical protein